MQNRKTEYHVTSGELRQSLPLESPKGDGWYLQDLLLNAQGWVALWVRSVEVER